MFKKFGRMGENLLLSMAVLAASLVVLFFLLNQIKSHTPAPVSTFAGGVADRASGAAYGF